MQHHVLRENDAWAFHSNHLLEETFREEAAAEGVMKKEEAPYCAIRYKLLDDTSASRGNRTKQENQK